MLSGLQSNLLCSSHSLGGIRLFHVDIIVPMELYISCAFSVDIIIAMLMISSNSESIILSIIGNENKSRCNNCVESMLLTVWIGSCGSEDEGFIIAMHSHISNSACDGRRNGMYDNGHVQLLN